MSALSRRGAQRRFAPPSIDPWLPVAASAGLAVALALILVHFNVLIAVAVALSPPGAWLLSRSYGGLAVGIALMLIVPYWLTFGTAQLTVLRLASAAAAATLLITRHFRAQATDYALLLLIVVLVAGWLLQYNQPHAGRVLSVELTPVGFYLGARTLPRPRIQIALLVTLFAGTIGALTVIYEYLRGGAVFIDPTSYVWNATGATIFRPGGVFGSPPGASTVLCFVILLGLACVTFARGRVKVLSAISLAICTVALVLTFTRAAMIAGAVGVLLFLWLVRSPLLRPLRVAWAAVAMVLLLLLIAPNLQRSAVFRAGILRAGTLAARESYWSTALPVATSSAHNLILGIGTGSLETPSVTNGAPVQASLVATPQLFHDSLHSQYITILVEQGLVGLAALALFLAVAGVPLARVAKTRQDPTSAAIAASIGAIAIIMAVDTTLLHGPSFAMLMLAAGLAANVMSDSGPGNLVSGPSTEPAS